MNIPLSIIENTYSHRRYAIPKVNKNVLYICLQSNCGCRVTSEIVADCLDDRYNTRKVCPDCGYTIWKVIK